MAQLIFIKYALAITLTVTLISLTTAWEWGGDIVFEDNFEGTSLDLNKWRYEESCGAGNSGIS